MFIPLLFLVNITFWIIQWKIFWKKRRIKIAKYCNFSSQKFQSFLIKYFLFWFIRYFQRYKREIASMWEVFTFFKNQYFWQFISQHANIVVIWSLSLDLLNILKRYIDIFNPTQPRFFWPTTGFGLNHSPYLKFDLLKLGSWNMVWVTYCKFNHILFRAYVLVKIWWH